MPEFLFRHRRTIAVAQACLFVLLGFLIASWWSTSDPGTTASPAVASRSAEASATIWTCSMHPQIRQPEPGDCPICGMDLVPVRPSADGERTISISDDIKQLMNVQVTPVERRYVTAEIRMVGKIEYDETRLARITAWVPGRLERMFVDYTGVNVNVGDHMVQIYSESLLTAQEELLAAIRRDEQPRSSRFVDAVDLVDSAREKLRLLGLTAAQIEAVEERGTSSETVTIYAPVSGVVVEKLKQQGDRVQTGDRIYTVADLQHLWVMLEAYESDLAWLRYGQQLEFTTEAYPGEVFHGQIAFIDPVLDEATRTVQVRVNVSNERGRLKPEMFVRAVVKSDIAAGGRVLDASLAGKWISPMHPEIVKDEPGECDVCGMPLVRAESMGYVTVDPDEAAKPLVVPATAVLRTGTRGIVYVQVPGAERPTYEGREIVLGSRAGDYYIVNSGLQAGELVVTQGNFKIDSALQIAAKPSMMNPQGGSQVPDAVQMQVQGLVPLYLAVGKALAADQFDQARAAIGPLRDYADQLSTLSEQDPATVAWNNERTDLSQIVTRLELATDLPSLRTAFALLSEQLLSLQKSFGTGEEASLYELHCPMAFGGRGASWIQADDAIRNPYYGASMLKCADRVDAL